MTQVTRINRLVMKGFKSFNKKTVVEFGDGFNCVLGPNGSGKCVTGDTLVHLADGSVEPIKEVVESALDNNPVEDMDDGVMAKGSGEQILSMDMDTLNVGPKPIEAFVKRTAPEKLLKIKTRSGKEVTATPYHPLFTLENGRVVGAKAENLDVGTRIAVPRKQSVNLETNFHEIMDMFEPEDNFYVPYKKEYEYIIRKVKEGTWEDFTRNSDVPKSVVKGLLDGQSVNFAHLVKMLRYVGKSDEDISSLVPEVKSKTGNKTISMPWKNSPEFSRFLGYLLSDGQINLDSNQVRFTNGCKEVIDNFVDISREVFDVEASVKKYKEGCWDVMIYSKPLARIMELFGVSRDGAGEKRVSNLYKKHCREEHIAELLNGFYCGDGYVSDRSIEFVTKSGELAYDISTLLQRLGIFASVRDVEKGIEKSGFKGSYKEVKIYGSDNFGKWRQTVKLSHPGKESQVAVPGKKSNPNNDLMNVNGLVKDVSKEAGINVKEFKKTFPKLDAYCYDQCTPSRTGVQQLVVDLFLSQDVASKSKLLRSLQNLAFSDIYWDEIVEIEEVEPEEEWVYDLCVADDHNFVANNMVVHNSNVFDALIFVLGKSGSKGMRAEQTANLIYNGGKTKEPAKKGIVEIYFDNTNDVFGTGNDELQLKRVVRQNGTSKYIIDGETKTRTEMLDLLARAKIDPDSHNIILQGDIVHLVEMSPVERRGMIEEVAGITIYEDKKNKAMRELNRVEERLNEADIILKERKNYLKELKKERDQAKKYKDLEEKLKRNKATLLNNRIKEKEDEVEKLEKEISEYEEELEDIRSGIEDMQDKIQEKKDKNEEIDEEIEEKGEKEQVDLNREVQEVRVELTRKEERLRTVKQELNRLADREKEVKTNLGEIEDKISDIEEEKEAHEARIEKKEDKIEEIEDKIEDYKDEKQLEDAEEVDERIEEIDELTDDLQEEVQELRKEQQELLREKDKLEVNIESVDDKIERVTEMEEEHEEDLEELKEKRERLKEVKHELNDRMQRESELAQELETVRGKLSSKRDKLSRLKAQQTSIKESIAGGEAVSAILDLKDKWNGIHGTIADLGKVDSEYSLALEIAAGSRMKSIVVEDDEVAEKCIKYLKDKKIGYADFIPLNKVKPRIIPAEVRNMTGKGGVQGLALDLVEFDDKFEKAFKYVFGSTLVVEDIKTARKLGIGKTRMVTLEGDVVKSSGGMTGGYRRKKRKGLGFQDKEVSEEIEELEEEVDDLEDVNENLTEEKKEVDERIDELKTEKGELEGRIIKIEKSLHLDSDDLDASREKKDELQTDLERVEDDLEEVRGKIDEKTDELTGLKVERQELREKLSNLRNPAVLAELNSLEEERNELKSEIAEMRGEAKSFTSELENVLVPDKENSEKILDQIEDDLADFEDEKEELEAEIEEKEEELKDMEEKQKEFQSKFRDLFEERQELSDEIKELEDEILGKNEEVREIEGEKNDVSIEKAERKAELSSLKEEFGKYDNVDVYKSKSEEKMKEEIDEFEDLTSEMGAVNMKALEIYEQVQHEYEQLQEKKDKLQEEREDVLVMINKIDARKRELFMKTYDALNDNFQKIFSKLSTKGEASLELEDEDDPFNGGVDIKVKLSGSKFLDIRSLSGGEKTLTALSFIFAVQEYEPAPFYVLDEVDAALDKRNSEKLAQLLRAYSDRAQYIIISHNDAVISEADNLYGLSMNEHGESKITSLEI